MYPKNMEEARELAWFIQKMERDSYKLDTQELLLHEWLRGRRKGEEAVPPATDNHPVDSAYIQQEKTYPCPCQTLWRILCMATQLAPILSEHEKVSNPTQTTAPSSIVASEKTDLDSASPSSSHESYCPLQAYWQAQCYGCNEQPDVHTQNNPSDLPEQGQTSPRLDRSRSTRVFACCQDKTTSRPCSRTSRVCSSDNQLSSCPDDTPEVQNPQPHTNINEHGGRP